MEDFDEIPVVDVSGLYSEDRKEREAVAKSIGDACRNVGFFYVRNHQVPPQLLVPSTYIKLSSTFYCFNCFYLFSSFFYL